MYASSRSKPCVLGEVRAATAVDSAERLTTRSIFSSDGTLGVPGSARRPAKRRIAAGPTTRTASRPSPISSAGSVRREFAR